MGKFLNEIRQESPQKRRDRISEILQGLNDQVVLEVININTVVLDDYRLHNTFRYYLINKYHLT